MLDLENKKQHVRNLNRTYRYRYDNDQYGTDTWRIMTEEPYQGDCEDYAVTLLWMMSGKSMVDFWINVITYKAQLVRVITKNGRGHVILRIGDLYIDNWTREFVSWDKMEELGHKKFLWMYDPLFVAFKMIKGRLVRFFNPTT
jgi:predicted transglutaminase-like cysteine proteinase